MQWCGVGRGELAATVIGDSAAPPVLLIAGGGGAMWSWARLLPEVWLSSAGPVGAMSPVGSLSTRFRVAVFDQAGVGLSATVAPASSADEAARDALSVGRQLLGDRFAVAGMSLGGAAAARAALIAPDVVEQLMLVCTFASASAFQPPATTAPSLAQDSEDDSDEIAAGVRRSLQLWFRDAEPEIVTSVIAASRATPVHSGLGENSIKVFLSHEGHDLSRITSPTSVVCGERDEVFPIANSEAIARLVPNSTLVRVPEAGHALHLEAPDVLIGALDRLLGSRGPE